MLGVGLAGFFFPAPTPKPPTKLLNLDKFSAMALVSSAPFGLVWFG